MELHCGESKSNLWTDLQMHWLFIYVISWYETLDMMEISIFKSSWSILSNHMAKKSAFV